MADGVRDVASLPDPVGRVLSDEIRPNGLHMVKTAVPIGVIAVIYEARPNVTADSAVLCLKSGNACILRGGKEAIHSSIAIAEIMRGALAGTPAADCIQLITDTTHESANELMHMNAYVDVLIPRGSKRLIAQWWRIPPCPSSRPAPESATYTWTRPPNIEMAANIIFNAKTSRPSVCNAAECMLIHRDIAEKALPVIAAKLKEKNTEIRGDAEVMEILKDRRRARHRRRLGP
jgi:glutamate-5-semialdehyde dehydrogenase